MQIETLIIVAGQADVVVAIGTFGRTPYVPGYAAELHPSIVQLHSSSCRPIRLESRKIRVGLPVFVFLAKHVITRRIVHRLSPEVRLD